MPQQSLRALAREFARGNLDRTSYRKQRAELLQGILSGTVKLEEKDFPPPVQPPEPESLDDTQRREDHKTQSGMPADPEAATPRRPAGAPPAPAAGPGEKGKAAGSGSRTRWMIVSVVVVVLLAVVFGAMMRDNGEEAGDTRAVASADKGEMESRSQSQAADAAETGGGAQTDAATTDTLIRDFLERKNWSTESLDAFRSAWESLPRAERLASRESLALGQLTNAIYKQLLEERALSGLVDDDSAVKKQRHLVEFAAALGIDDPRIRLPESQDMMNDKDSTPPR